MNDQPLLPVRELPRSMNYEPVEGDGVEWTIDCWPALVEAFGLVESELVTWHTDLSATGAPWLVIRRIFGVKAVFGDAVEDEDMEDWDWKKLANRLGVAESKLRDDLARAVEFWRKNSNARRIGQVVKPLDASSPDAIAESLSEERISKLLKDYRFDHLKGEDREFTARRITELYTLFTDKNRREPARQLVMMELHLHDSEKVRAALKGRLDVLHGKENLQDKESTELLKIQEALERHEKSHSALQKNYLAAASEIGADEVEQGELRKAALGTASFFVESAREYYQDGTRALIDGVFSAEELEWLTTPIPMRPAQYRPDIVIAVNEAMNPFNLFNPDYTPSKIPREASRRMLNIARGMMDEEDPPVIDEIDSVPTDGDDVEVEESVSTAEPDENASPPEPLPALDPPSHDLADIMAM